MIHNVWTVNMADPGAPVPTTHGDSQRWHMLPRATYDRYRALADAVTRLHEAHDLVRGINGSADWNGVDFMIAMDHYHECFAAVLAARAALDEGGPDGR